MDEQSENPVVDLVSYTQDLLSAAKEEQKDGDPPAKDAGEKATEETEETPKDDGGEPEGEQAAGEEEKVEEKPVDKLDQLDVWLKKEREHFKRELELKEKYKDAPSWKAKADEYDRIASDPLGYLEEKAPQLLEHWIERRYGASLGKKEEEKKPQVDPRVDSLMKEIQVLKQELTSSKQASLVDQYVSSIHTAIREYKSDAATAEDYSVVEEYCNAHGYDLAREIFEYASQVAANSKQVVPPAEALKAVREYIKKDLEISGSLASKRSAKSESSSEEKPAKKPTTKTLSTNLKGSATKPADLDVTDLDSYKADLLRELRKGGKG